MFKRSTWLGILAALSLSAVAAAPSPAAAGPSARPAVDPRAVAAVRAHGHAWLLVSLAEKADLGGATRVSGKAARTRFVYERLRAVADRTQPALVALLTRRGAQVERFWVDNMLRVHADSAVLTLLSERPEVQWVRLEGRIHLIEPVPAVAPEEALVAWPLGLSVVESGLKDINADEVWKMGFKGQDVVVAITDTGAELRHPAIKKNYRGYPEMTHDYNWLDAVKDEQEPLDLGSHGTHVTGTSVGSDPVRQTGAAPAAKFIACRLIEERSGPDSASLRCLQWVLAPTKLDGSEPRPDLAPDIVNASWGNDPGGQCLVNTLREAVRSLNAAGILFVAAAGNSGDKCDTICVPGAYEESFTVANYDSRSKQINDSSSRGPVAWPGGELVKPDIAAPGTDINSSIPPSRYEKLTGTSMAAPHITGAAALVLSARPELRGRPEILRQLLEASAAGGRNAGRCGPTGQSDKNNLEGRGLVDVKKAVVAALTATPPPPPTPTYTPSPRPTATDTPLPPTASDTPENPATPTATEAPHFQVYVPYITRRWTILPTP